MASWHDGEEEPSFWPMLMRSGVLVIGSLMNVTEITASRIRLIALPMKIRGACAAPCRLIAVVPSLVAGKRICKFAGRHVEARSVGNETF